MEKIIHYCWFGKKRKPKKVLKCIKSWKKFLPNFEIKEWNESNFDIENSCEYVKEAYKNKVWAFVSDYVRFKVLYLYGGIYMDTDVKVLKPFINNINIPFLALEKTCDINPGLICGFNKEDTFVKDMLEEYENSKYIHGDGNQYTICQRTTNWFIKKGFVKKDIFQVVSGYSIYPSEYFCPKDYRNNKKYITSNTIAIHLYDGSWMNRKTKFKNKFSNFLSKILGKERKEKLLSKRKH